MFTGAGALSARAMYMPNTTIADWCGSSGLVYEFGNLSCLRPVVSLSSSVKIDQVSKIDGEVQETWNDPLNKY